MKFSVTRYRVRSKLVEARGRKVRCRRGFVARCTRRLQGPSDPLKLLLLLLLLLLYVPSKFCV